MTRIAFILSILAVVVAGSYYLGTQRDMVNDIQHQIDTQREIDNAQNACPDDLPFLERLQCHNKRTGDL